MCFFVQTNHTRKELLFLMFKEINLRNHSSLHKLFYSLVFSIITDLFIFCNISNTYKRNKITIWVIGLIAILLAIFSPTQLFMNFGVTILEIIMLSLYFICIKKQNIKIILGSCLIFGITDLSILTLEAFFKIIVPIENNILNYIFDLIVSIVIICVTKKYKRL